MSTKSFVGATAGLTVLVLLAVVAVSALPADAAGDYAFTIRGIVESVDSKNNKIQVTGTKSSTQAVTDTQSKKVQYSLKTAKVYKWEGGKQVPRNINHLRANDEVVMKGNKKSGTFVVDTLTVNDRSFEVVGRVKDYNTSENWIKVLVGRSTLQHAGVVNTQIKFYYDDDTAKCFRLGSSIDCSEIVNENQGVKIRGLRSTNGGRWEATHFYNRYPL